LALLGFAEENVSRSPESIAGGEKLFVSACAGCHGKTGEGGRGPNLNDGKLVRRLNDQRLFSAIKAGVPGSDMPAFPIGDQKIWQIVSYLRSLSSPAIAAPLAGDMKAGREIFFGTGQCSNCHMIRGQGGVLGPDLSNVGASRSLKQLRESVQKPDERIAEGFAGATVTTKSGMKLSGIIKNSNNYSLQLIDAKGALHLMDAMDIQKIEPSPQSLMPNVTDKLRAEDMNNVIAFLSQQTLRPEVAGARESRKRK
jgi:putative heme-binding domain-containing protein